MIAKAVLVGLLFAASPKNTNTTYVKVVASKKTETIKGLKGEALVILEITPGYHIQANPAAAPNLIPTTVSLQGPMSLSWGEAIYPIGKPYRLANAANEISTYDGKIEIRIPFAVSATAKTGRVFADGKLRYQACNDKTCFFPTNLSFKLPIQMN